MPNILVIENEFYLLDCKEKGSERTLHKGMSTAVTKIREHLKKGAKSENVSLVRFRIDKDAYGAQEIGWGEITEKLIQGEA